MKVVLVAVLALQLCACFRVTKSEWTVSGRGYGVESAKFLATVFESISPGKVLVAVGLAEEGEQCVYEFSYEEAQVLGFSNDELRGRKKRGPEDPRNMVRIHKKVEACPEREEFLRERNRAFVRVMRGH